MSVDALMDSDQMSREMIERVGPRVALQPCDDPKYRELALEFLDFAAECEEPITVICLSDADTVKVDYEHIGHLESGTQLAIYNSILALHLHGEAEVPMEVFVDTVDWGGQSLTQSEKLILVYDAVTHLEAWVPHATFFADASSGILHLERDIVVIDNRFTNMPFEKPEERERLTKVPDTDTVEDQSIDDVAITAPVEQSLELEVVEEGIEVLQTAEVIVEEQVVVLEGIARQKRKAQPKFDVEVEGVTMTFSQDELAILLYAVGLQPHTKFRSADVLGSQYWVDDDRSLDDMRPAFSHAAARLSSKLPGIFQLDGERINRRYHLTSIPALKQHANTGEADSIGLKLLMANFLSDFRQDRPLGIDNFSLATLQKIIYGDFDRSLSLQPVKLSLMLEVTEDIATRLLNYDLIAVNEAIIDRCYAVLGAVRNRRNALLLSEALEANERQVGSQKNSTSIASGSLKKEEHDYEWYDYGNCLGVDPDLFFPERGASTREAKEVCRGCEVRLDCLEHALQNGEKFGIWGGLSERERRRIRRQRAKAARETITP